MSMGWMMPTIGTRVVERRKSRAERIAMPEGGWLFRPFVPQTSLHRNADPAPVASPGDAQTSVELTESAPDRTILAG